MRISYNILYFDEVVQIINAFYIAKIPGGEINMEDKIKVEKKKEDVKKIVQKLNLTSSEFVDEELELLVNDEILSDTDEVNI